MKIPSPSLVSAMALRSLQASEPTIFEDSFQTLTAASLSWIDEGLYSQIEESGSLLSDYSSEISLQDEGLISSTLSGDNEAQHHNERVVAEALLRKIVFRILDKYSDISSPRDVEEALKHHRLPEKLRSELSTKYGGSPPLTWYDALRQLEDFCVNKIELDGDENRVGQGENSAFIKEALWESVLDHPITSYVPVQCQSCGEHVVPDENPISSGLSDAELGLREELPSSEEAPFVRTGWFRGPRLSPIVFVLDCPKCGAVSRWFRSRDPQIILNPNKWGRLCGEQEDLRLDLANYFGFVAIRTVVPLDWDHIWSEFRILEKDGDEFSTNWKLRNDDNNFAARLDEGIGSWTRVLAISPNPDLCQDVTSSYLSCKIDGGQANDHFVHDMNRYRQQVIEARKDKNGILTQSGTIHGYAIERAGLSTSEITLIMKRAARDYGQRRKWYEVSNANEGN